jgi:tetratricopeptide (TPR) repeat protein
MMNHLPLSRALMILMAFFLATSPAVYAQKKKKSGAKELSEQDRVKAMYAFFDGQKEKVSGNDQRAAEQFAQCLRIDPSNHAAMYELASIYNSKRKLGDALYFCKKAVELDPGNEWYSLLLADTYERMGKYDDAVAIYRELYKKSPGKVEYLFSEADGLLMQGKLSDAIKVYDRIEQFIGVNQEMSQQKQRLFLKMGKVDLAAAELEKLIAAEPNNLDYYSLLVEMWQVNNQPEKAMQIIRRMQAVDPESPNVFLALAEQYRIEGKRNESFAQLKKAFASPQLGSEMKVRILTSYLPLVESSPELMDQALELSALLSETHPREAIAQTVYGDFLAINKKYPEARERYRAGLAIDKRNLQAWQQLLLLESELRDYPAMRIEAEEALGLFPDQSVLYLFTGIAMIQVKDYETAASRLLSGSKLVVDNDQQLIEFYSSLGEVYDKLKRYEDCDKYYQKALNIDKDNSFILNNWSYYLSLRKDQLELAAKMSLRSNELSPGNPSFQDTYAWILYVQGKYSDARTWLEKAMASGGADNGTILEHYGDVLFRLGQVEDAVGYWKKAKEKGEYSDFLEKKIADKKLYE